MPDYKVPRPVIEAFERIQAERDNALAECEQLGRQLAAKDQENVNLRESLSQAQTQINADELTIETLRECISIYRDTLAALQAEANLAGAAANAETARIGVQRQAG